MELLLTIFSDKIPSLLNKIWIKISYTYFKFFVDKPPYTEEETINFAYGVLSGQIDKAVSFRNMGSKYIFISVLQRNSLKDHFYTIILLKRIGATFKVEWKHELLPLNLDFEVEDIQKNGSHDIAFIERSHGTGGGSDILHIRNSENKYYYKIVESYNYTDAKSAGSPKVTFDPEIDHKHFQKIEAFALANGMLKGKAPDFSKPEHAVQNWHRMNGDIQAGEEFELVFYPGKPVYGSRPVIVSENNSIKWMGYFKGPLFGYLKEKDTHFVAYSSSYRDNWPTELSATGNKVSFKRHLESNSITFEFLGAKGKLHSN